MELVDGRYCIQGVDLEQLTEEYGTPLYIYDANKIKAQFDRLNSAFGSVDLKIKFACKSLTNLSILKLLKSYGSELDCVSIQEVQLGLKAGFKPEQILYTPNCVSFSEIKEAVEIGVMINLDNISILEQFGNEYHNSVPVCIRLNPHIMAGGNKKISTGHADSKFGISIYQMAHILKVVSTYNLNVVGLHMHTGSDILDAEVFLRAADILFDAAKNFPSLDFIDFGSGFKVAYKEEDITTDIEDVGNKLSKAFDEFCDRYGTLNPLPKSIKSRLGKFLAASNRISAALRKTSASRISDPVCICNPTTFKL